MKDLSNLAREIEQLVKEYTGTSQRIGVGVCFTMPPEYDEVFFVTNLTRPDGIKLFEQTATKMKTKAN